MELHILTLAVFRRVSVEQSYRVFRTLIMKICCENERVKSW